MKFENINHPTALNIDINGIDLTIKSRPDDSLSKWAVIAFTPSCSLRCSKIHREEHFVAYSEAIAAACGSFDEEDAEAIRNAIMSITTNPPTI